MRQVAGSGCSLNQPIRVMVVDDSAVVRGLLVRALANDDDVSVVGTAMHGEAALRQLRSQPADVVILDVEMPVMDGLAALPHILAEFPETRVIMASALTCEGAEPTVRALALGAAGCIAKPQAASVGAGIEILAGELLPLVKALRRPAAEHSPSGQGPGLTAPSLQGGARTFPEVIVIGSSTGGPNALGRVLGQLPESVDCPILIVQHMPPAFTPILAQHLEKDSGRPCCEALHRGDIMRGRMYVAPGNFHLAIVRKEGRLLTTLNQGPPEHYCRPSVNPLFNSAAECYGNRTLAVMLTGMGDDGIEGTRAIAGRGGLVIAQDEATSVVWGMPGAVVRAGLAHEVLPLDSIRSALVRHCSRELALR